MRSLLSTVFKTKTRGCLQTRLSPHTVYTLALLAAPFGLYADINPGGSLSSFEVYNDSGKPSHGFEIQIDNSAASDLYYTGFSQRYGAGKITPFATPTGNGINVRWQSPKDPTTGDYSLTTPIHDPASTTYSWQDCYAGGSGYATSGCEIYGQGLRYPYNPNLSARGYFLVDDSANPGSLIRNVTPVAIPTVPFYSFPPTATITAPPVVVVEVEAPEPPETPETYGDAQWMKIYKAELTHSATAKDLITTSASVPKTAAQLEVSWDLLQASPPSGGKQKRKGHSAGVKPGSRAVIRRIETYAYTGGYDAVTHQAICADLTCTAPSPGEVGKFVGANNTAVNINPDSLVVTKSGKGTISDATRTISCGSTCASFINKGGVFNLTATPASGSVFVGWKGACSGTLPSCAVTVNGVTKVSAIFKPLFTVSVAVTNKGKVTAVPPGNDNSINCGSVCKATFTQGTIVTFTATPDAGKSFVDWSGGCVGTAPVCSFTLNANTSVKATFSK